MSTEHRYDSVELVPESIVRPFARAALLAALTGAVALVEIPIPFSLAPLTLQVLFVFLAGLYLGPVWGPISMLLYVVAGAAGAPVYAGGKAGLAHLFGVTGGYLFSYPVAAFAIGLLVHGRGGIGFGTGWSWRTDGVTGFFDRLVVRDPADVALPVLVLALAVGAIVVYAIGATYVMILLALTPAEAAAQYVAPFVLAELCKLVAAVAIVRNGLIDLT